MAVSQKCRLLSTGMFTKVSSSSIHSTQEITRGKNKQVPDRREKEKHDEVYKDRAPSNIKHNCAVDNSTAGLTDVGLGKRCGHERLCDIVLLIQGSGTLWSLVANKTHMTLEI